MKTWSSRCLTAVIMTVLVCLVVLLVAPGVSTDHKEKHSLYHIYTAHYSSPPNTDPIPEVTVAVLFDGIQVVFYSDGSDMVSAQGEPSWNSRATMKKEVQMFLNESEVFIPFLEDRSEDDHRFVKTCGCEIETSSSGDVTFLNTTTEYRHNGKAILYFNVDSGQWMVLDNAFLPVKFMWDNNPQVNRITKDYLLRRCKDRLLSYPDDYDIIYDYSDYFSSVPDVEPALSVLSTRLIILSSIIILMGFVLVLLAVRRGYTTKYSFINGEMDWVLLCLKKKIKKGKTTEASREESREHFTRSMDIPLTLADGHNSGRLTHTVGLTTAGGRCDLKSVSLPNLATENKDCSDSE